MKKHPKLSREAHPKGLRPSVSHVSDAGFTVGTQFLLLLSNLHFSPLLKTKAHDAALTFYKLIHGVDYTEAGVNKIHSDPVHLQR